MNNIIWRPQHKGQKPRKLATAFEVLNDTPQTKISSTKNLETWTIVAICLSLLRNLQEVVHAFFFYPSKICYAIETHSFLWFIMKV